MVFNPSDNFFLLILPNINYSSDPINDPIIQSLNQRDLDILKIIINNPGSNSKQIFEIIKKDNSDITVDIIKNSLKRKLNTLCEFRGSRNFGGYYLIRK